MNNKNKQDNLATERRSTSRVLLVCSFVLISIVGVLQAFDIVQSTGPLMELFITTSVLYFGRQFSFNQFLSGFNKTSTKSVNKRK